jgi:hypothetical protein
MEQIETLKLLGLSEEKLREIVLKGIVDKLLYCRIEGEYPAESEFKKELNTLVKDTIKTTVEDIGKEHVVPQIEAKIDNLVLQETKKWGGPKGEPQSFPEFMVARAEEFMVEMVDARGNTQTQVNKRREMWRPEGSRISYIVDRYLKRRIEDAMGTAMSVANKAIAKTISDAVNARLEEIVGQIKCAIKIG